MKNLLIVLTLIIGFASSAQAHHMAQSDTAGIYIPETSPHLDMVFY